MRSRILVITILMTLVLWVGLIAPASASVRQIEEAPGQMLYQSRQTLEDKLGNTWQVVFFKQTKTGQSPTINLRLVGFPGAIAFLHPKALKIEVSPGVILTAADVFAEQSPAPNVGQYDFNEIANSLQSNSFWELELPLIGKNSVQLRIPYFVIQEWQTVATS